MAIKFREEFVGKRFLCLKSTGKLKNVFEWDWKAGVVRAVSQNYPSPKSKDFQVLVEFDGLPWQKREWIKPNGAYQAFLVEKALVWVTPTAENTSAAKTVDGKLSPALSFVPVIDKVGVKGSKLSPVEFLEDKHLEFQEENKFIVHQEDSKLPPGCSDKETAAVKAWVEFQAGQSILLTTPTILVGFRVQVYRSEGTTQWYTAVIRQYNSATQELCLLDDTVLEEHDENPALIEIKLLGNGVVEAILKGTEIRSTPRRCNLAKEKEVPGTHTPSSVQSSAKGSKAPPVTPAQRVSVVRTNKRAKAEKPSERATGSPSTVPPSANTTGRSVEEGGVVNVAAQKRELRKRKADTPDSAAKAPALATSSRSSPAQSTKGDTTGKPAPQRKERKSRQIKQESASAQSSPAEGHAQSSKQVTGGSPSVPSTSAPSTSAPSTSAPSASIPSASAPSPTPVRKRKTRSPVVTIKPEPVLWKAENITKPTSVSPKAAPTSVSPKAAPTSVRPLKSATKPKPSTQTPTATDHSSSSAATSSTGSTPDDTYQKRHLNLSQESAGCTSEGTPAQILPSASTPNQQLEKLTSESVDNGSTSGYSSTADNLSPRHDKMNGTLERNPLTNAGPTNMKVGGVNGRSSTEKDAMDNRFPPSTTSVPGKGSHSRDSVAPTSKPGLPPALEHNAPVAFPNKTSQGPVHVYRDPDLLRKDEEGRWKQRQTGSTPSAQPRASSTTSQKSQASAIPTASQSPAAFPPALHNQVQMQHALLLAAQQQRAVAASQLGLSFPGVPPNLMGMGQFPYDTGSPAHFHLFQQQQHQQQMQQMATLYYANLNSQFANLDTATATALWQQKMQASLTIPPVTAGSAAPFMLPFQEQVMAELQREQQSKAEREKKRERQLEKERAEKEKAARLEKERKEKEKASKESAAAAAVNRHFSESLRLAGEKEKGRDKPPLDRASAGTSDSGKVSAPEQDKGVFNHHPHLLSEMDSKVTVGQESTRAHPVSAHNAKSQSTKSPAGAGPSVKQEPKLNIYGYQPQSHTTFISQDQLQQRLIKGDKDARGPTLQQPLPHPAKWDGSRNESVIHHSMSVSSDPSRSLNGGSGLKRKSPRGGKAGSNSSSHKKDSTTPAGASTAAGYNLVMDGLLPNPLYSNMASKFSSSSSALTASNSLTSLGKPLSQYDQASAHTKNSASTSSLPSSSSVTTASASHQGAFPSSLSAWQSVRTSTPSASITTFKSFVEEAVTEAFYKDIEKEKQVEAASLVQGKEIADNSESYALKRFGKPAGEQPITSSLLDPVSIAEIPQVVNGMNAIDTDSDTLSAPSPTPSSIAESSMGLANRPTPTSNYTNHKKAWLQRHSNEDSNQSGGALRDPSSASGALCNGTSASQPPHFDSSSTHGSTDQGSDQEATPPKRKKPMGKTGDNKRPKVLKKRKSQEGSADGPPQKRWIKKEDFSGSTTAPKPKPRKKAAPQVYYLQDGFCTEKAPNLKKCRECKVSQKNPSTKLSNIFCRFYAFRRLKVNAKGTICTAGFSEPTDATQDDIDLWLPHQSSPSLDLLTAKYIIANVGDEFCKLVEEEKECRKWAQPNAQIAWKRAVQGVREMCDVCCTTLFNMHWTCHNCGFVVCLDCYKEKRIENGTGLPEEQTTSAPMASSRKWLTCSVSRTMHETEKMLLTQIIPGNTLSKVGDMVHDIRRKHFIRSKCPCGVNDGFDKSPPAKRNGVSQQLLNVVSQTMSASFPDSALRPFAGADASASSMSLSSSLDPKALHSYPNDPLSFLADVASSVGDKEDTPLPTSSHSLSSLSALASVSSTAPMLDSVPPTEGGAMDSRAGVSSSATTLSEADQAKGRTLRKLLTDKDKMEAEANKPASTSGPVITSLDDFIQTVVESSLSSGCEEKAPVPQPGVVTVSPSSVMEYSHYQPRFGTFMKGREQPVPLCSLKETSTLYPGVPHSWLCEGMLLRLHDSKHSRNFTLFNQRWRLGLPVVVSNVTKAMDSKLWHPSEFSKDFGHISHDLVNCQNGVVLIGHHLRDFWDGFENIGNRLVDKNRSEPMLLKLKDWPSTEDFSELMPSRFEDLMQALPMPEYTQRRGHLNLACRLPDFFVKPDLGPKMYNAYGLAKYPEYGTTNLHLDVSDAVNVMVYVAKQEDLDPYVMSAIEASDADPLMVQRVVEGGERPGALWHIFDACDADKIRDMLNKVAKERGEDIEPSTDPIHDQSFYLDKALRRRLKLEYGVQGYPIIQCAGDAIFIPAGAPHQVQNLNSCVKVAEDFVSPEHLHHCFKLTQEFRQLSGTHSNHEDKLQVKNIIYHAVKDAVAVLKDQDPVTP